MTILGVYLTWIILAEALFFDPQVGLWTHTSLLAALLIHSVLDRSRPTGCVWLCLSLVPIIRIINHAALLSVFHLLYWCLIIGIPLFIAG